MLMPCFRTYRRSVVPHTGDVDRNEESEVFVVKSRKSSPPPGAWIEIMIKRRYMNINAVLPPQGGVDRKK